MSLPDWRASHAGARSRVALWLLTEIGESGTFTKAQLRDAFPGVEQIDRRMRELRAEGWQISTYREDRSLGVDELRLITVGGRVWEHGYRTRQAAVSDADRARALEADGFACRVCGISAGEPYPDDRLRTAKLSAERAAKPGGGAPYLLALCERCLVGRSRRRDIDGTLAAEAEAQAHAVTQLPDDGLLEFARWTAAGQRDRSLAETLWSRYSALPHEVRDEIARAAAAELQHRRESADWSANHTREAQPE